MSAYVVVAIEITDPKGFAKYQELAGPAIEARKGAARLVMFAVEGT